MLSSLSQHRSRWTAARLLVSALALLIFLFGFCFIVFGAQLAWLGGSWYYALCGIALAASGFFMLRQHPVGGWLYLLAWFLTIPWTIYEVGFDFWGWLPRLLGPSLIAIAVALSLPYLYGFQKESPHA